MNGTEAIGYSAQENREVMPACVTESGRAVTPDGKTIDDALALNYSGMTAYNTQVLKEQDAIIREMLARIEKLETALKER